MKYLTPSSTFFWILISMVFIPIGGIAMDWGMQITGIAFICVGVVLIVVAPLASEIVRSDK